MFGQFDELEAAALPLNMERNFSSVKVVENRFNVQLSPSACKICICVFMRAI
jgi:hypothetical protein